MSKALENLQNKFRKPTEKPGQIQRQRSERSLSPRALTSSLTQRRTPPIRRQSLTLDPNNQGPQLHQVFDQQLTESLPITQPPFNFEQAARELLQTQDELKHSSSEDESEMATQTETQEQLE